MFTLPMGVSSNSTFHPSNCMNAKAVVVQNICFELSDFVTNSANFKDSWIFCHDNKPN